MALPKIAASALPERGDVSADGEPDAVGEHFESADRPSFSDALYSLLFRKISLPLLSRRKEGGTELPFAKAVVRLAGEGVKLISSPVHPFRRSGSPKC